MFSISKLSLVCALVLVSTASAQSSVSTDPLNGSSFSTAFFTPENTYTPPTTFQSATNVSPTTLIGVGPSVATNSASFSYNIPDATVGVTTNSELYSSLAKAGKPTSQGNDLSPDGQNLQIVGNQQDDAALRQSAGSIAMLVAGVLAGAGVMFL